jgi:hypothetical protein
MVTVYREVMLFLYKTEDLLKDKSRKFLTKLLNFYHRLLEEYKDKAIPLQAWTGPEVSGKLRLQISRHKAHECAKVVSPMHHPPLPPRKYSWFLFLLEFDSTPGS